MFPMGGVMDWLNIHIPTVLRSPEYVGSSPAERGTWLCVLSYACSIECGGVLVGAAGWKDRQWQQSCGVTLREVMASKRLLRVVGDDVEVNGYPKESEEKVRKNRKNGVAGAMARWAKAMDDAKPHGMPHAKPHGMPCANGKGEGEGEGEGESKYTPISPTESPSSNCASDDRKPWPGTDEWPHQEDLMDQVQPETPAPEPAPARKQKTPEQTSTPSEFDFILDNGQTWNAPQELVDSIKKTYPKINIQEQLRKAALWLQTNQERRKTARGMPKFLSGWIERSSNGPHGERTGKPSGNGNIPLDSNGYPDVFRMWKEGIKLEGMEADWK
jgi:hypothetical protein